MIRCRVSAPAPLPPTRPHGHVDVEVGAVDGEEVERGQAKQSHRRHEVEVGVVGDGQVPDQGQGQAKERDEKCRDVEGLALEHLVTPWVARLWCAALLGGRGRGGEGGHEAVDDAHVEHTAATQRAGLVSQHLMK